MNLAGASNATPEQLRSLGSYIQALARDVPSSSQTPPDRTSQEVNNMAPLQSTMPPDLIIEFSENRNDRWLLPRDSEICCLQLPPGLRHAEVSLKIKLNPKWLFSDFDDDHGGLSSEQHHVKLNFCKTTPSIKTAFTSRFPHAIPELVRCFLDET